MSLYPLSGCCWPQSVLINRKRCLKAPMVFRVVNSLYLYSFLFPHHYINNKYCYIMPQGQAVTEKTWHWVEESRTRNYDYDESLYIFLNILFLGHFYNCICIYWYHSIKIHIWINGLIFSEMTSQWASGRTTGKCPKTSELGLLLCSPLFHFYANANKCHKKNMVDAEKYILQTNFKKNF